MKKVPLLLASFWSISSHIIAATSDEPKGHPLEVYNGSGSGNYGSGETVTITGTRPASSNASASTNSGGANQQNDWVFIRWLKPEGGGRIENPSEETTTLTMSDKKTVVVAVYGKINAWFPPGNETSSKGLLLPKNPQSQEQFRLEHRTRVTISMEEGSNVLSPAKVWEQISVTLGWFPSRECEGIWHSSELVKYWDSSSQGTEINWEASIPKSQFEEKSPGVYEASVWYEGNWTMNQLPAKVDQDKNPVMPKTLTGFSLVIHAPKYSNTLQGTSGTLAPVDIAVDANRDGVIKFAGNVDDLMFAGKPSDKTSESSPFRFWCNDDHDGAGLGEETLTGAANSADNEIKSARDLEDFARLHLYVGGLQEAIANGTIKVGLEWRNVTGTDSPSIKAYRAAEPNGGNKYLKKDNGEYYASLQTATPFTTALGTIDSTGKFKFPEDFWTSTGSGIPTFGVDHPTRYILFEGVTEGKGQLVMTFWKGTEKIGEGGGCWLDIKNIKRMYQRGKAQPEGIAAPHNSLEGPFNGPTNSVADEWNWPFEKDPNEEKKAIIFVHGWSMDYPTYINFSETMFKRLWQQGFNGRFCTFRWDPLVANEAHLYAGEYNRSEHRAFVYGRALKQFVETIKQEIPTVNLVGHSMGNIVCGSALQQGLTVKNYLLMEAAVPAGCYDEGGGSGAGGVNGYERFWIEEGSRPTPDYHNSAKGYRGFLKAISTNAQLVNFHNVQDFALFTGTKFYWFQANWEKNEVDYKPDGNFAVNWRYWYNANESDQSKKGSLQTYETLLGNPYWKHARYTNDFYEMKAFIARPRSKAAGAVDASLGNRPSNMQHVNMNAAPYNFDNRESDHSGQFNRRIQEVDDLYREIGVRAGVLPLQ